MMRCAPSIYIVSATMAIPDLMRYAPDSLLGALLGALSHAFMARFRTGRPLVIVLDERMEIRRANDALPSSAALTLELARTAAYPRVMTLQQLVHDPVLTVMTN